MDIERAKKILEKHGRKYSDQELKKLISVIDQLIAIDYENYKRDNGYKRALGVNND